jgi:N-acyl-D-amino-acid deacylase
MARLSRETGATVTFTHAQPDFAPHRLGQVIDWVREANREPGVHLRPQIFPRPVGMILSLDLSANPFMECPAYKAIAGLPLAERVAEMRKPAVRARIVSDAAGVPTLPLMALARNFARMYPLGAEPDYEPDPATSVAAVAEAKGVFPEEIAYDLLLEQDGHATLLVALGNYVDGTLERMREHLVGGDAVLALGDGGAHYGLICDASYPTFMLTHWVRDRAKGRIGLADTIRAMTKVPADLAGMGDRGELAVGKKADINLIDLNALRLHAPEVRWDLPAGGRRLDQRATGYRATIVGGRVIQRDGEPTAERPGRLVRARG